MADDGNVMRAVTFLIVFSFIFSFMFAYSSSAFSGGPTPNEDDFIKRNFSPEELGTMTIWENDADGTGNDTIGGYAHNVTDTTTWGSEVIVPLWNGEPECDGTRFDFYNPDNEQHVRVYPIGDDDTWSGNKDIATITNCFVVYEQWGWWDKEWELISFGLIIQNLKTTDEGVKSGVHVDLKGGMDIYFLFPVGTTAASALAILTVGYGFHIVVAQSYIDELESGNNVWNSLTGLLTFSIDTGFWILDYIISLPIYAAIAFIAFYIIKELIP